MVGPELGTAAVLLTRGLKAPAWPPMKAPEPMGRLWGRPPVRLAGATRAYGCPLGPDR